MSVLLTLTISVIAGIIANFISKWLNRNDKDN
jgi:hypothetical protein